MDVDKAGLGEELPQDTDAGGVGWALKKELPDTGGGSPAATAAASRSRAAYSTLRQKCKKASRQREKAASPAGVSKVRKWGTNARTWAGKVSTG